MIRKIMVNPKQNSLNNLLEMFEINKTIHFESDTENLIKTNKFYR